MRCRFNKNFKNGIAGWYFETKEIEKAYKDGGILMLDVEYGINCKLHCEYCFRTDDDRDRIHRPTPSPLSCDDMFYIVDQAKEMGAKSIHVVGKGESLEEPKFLSIIRYIAKKGIIPIIFTAGHVLGDDKLTQEIHNMTGEELVKELYRLRTSIILKINSLNHIIQNGLVRCPTIKYKDGGPHDFNFTQFRDIAFERLMKMGFNKLTHNPTRLGTATVMLKSNYHELFHHYRYFRSLNIYPIINTVVPCGRTKNMNEVENISPSPEEKLEFWKKVYSFNIENGINYEGVSSYIGGHICSQLGYSMYINVFGEVFDCPSSTRKSLGNVKLNGNNGKKLSVLWKQSSFRKRYKNCMDNGCPWRFSHTEMIPKSLFRAVHEYLKKNYPYDQNVQNFIPPKYYG